MRKTLTRTVVILFITVLLCLPVYAATTDNNCRFAGQQLDGYEHIIYTVLADGIEKIASETKYRPEFEVSIDELGIVGSWSANDLSVESLITGDSISEDAWAALQNKVEIDYELILTALCADYPFDLYWFDKTNGILDEYVLVFNLTNIDGEEQISFSSESKNCQ